MLDMGWLTSNCVADTGGLSAFTSRLGLGGWGRVCVWGEGGTVVGWMGWWTSHAVCQQLMRVGHFGGMLAMVLAGIPVQTIIAPGWYWMDEMQMLCFHRLIT